MIYFFELIHHITQPNSAVELPNKLIPSPMSLDESIKIPPMQTTISPGAIKYSGFSFNNFFIFCIFYRFGILLRLSDKVK